MQRTAPIVLPAERDGQAATTTWHSFADLAEHVAKHARRAPETPRQGDAATETEEDA